MQKVIIIGCPGSSKSTLAKKMHEITHLPVIHLDNLYWNSDKTTVSNEEWMARLSYALALDKWIIDGNYASSMEYRMQASDTIIFLDYPNDVCIDGIKRRVGMKHDDLPWIETELDDQFLDFVAHFNTDSRENILHLLHKYKDKNIVILKNRNDADNYLIQLSKDC